MEKKISNAIVAATKDIFNTMIMMDVKDGDPFPNGINAAIFDYTGIIGFSGAATGALGVHFPKSMAAAIASAMLGTPIEETSQEVRDTVGELTNMIAGGLRNELSQFGIEFEISIPTVVEGEHHKTAMMIDGPRISVPFQVEKGSFIVEACLKQA